jgi:hypothetical protein
MKKLILLVGGLGWLSGCGDCYDNENPGSCAGPKPADDSPGTDDSPAPDDSDSSSDSDGPPLPGSCEALRIDAKKILGDYCYKCHGSGGAVEGGINYILDVPTLISNNKLVPLNSGASRIYQRMNGGGMPPANNNMPTAEEIEAIHSWIDSCHETDIDFNAPIDHTFIPLDVVLNTIDDDLDSIASAQKPYIRYISLVHLYNNNTPEDVLNTYRMGLNKVINSLSWEAQIVAPSGVPFSSSDTTDYDISEGEILIYRIDLRDYRWDAESRNDGIDAWEYLISRYPYAFDYGRNSGRYSKFTDIQTATTSRLPILNGDWLVRTGAVPPLYHQILEIPETQIGFLDLFDVDQFTDMEQRNVVRAGFLRSGVSDYNRLIERHDAQYGYCWVSYDFGSEVGDQNLNTNPLIGYNLVDDVALLNDVDIQAAAGAFDGGELICSLPNGLQAYLLAKSNGERLDIGPTSVVMDPLGIEGGSAVVNGLSCMNCHYAGIIPKDDEIRDQVLEGEYPDTVQQLVEEIYHPNRATDGTCPDNANPPYLCAIEAEDQEKFLGALDDAAIPRTIENYDDDFANVVDGDTLTDFIVEGEPAYQLASAFEDYLDVERSAAELWLDTNEVRFPDDIPSLIEIQVSALTTNNEISRDQFLAVAQDLTCFYHGTGAATFDSTTATCVSETNACGSSGIACLSGQSCAELVYVRSEIGGKDGQELSQGICIKTTLCSGSEVCNNNFDDDCNGTADDGCP